MQNVSFGRHAKNTADLDAYFCARESPTPSQRCVKDKGESVTGWRSYLVKTPPVAPAYTHVGTKKEGVPRRIWTRDFVRAHFPHRIDAAPTTLACVREVGARIWQNASYRPS